MKRVMFVAHPDDESLWGAGLILRYPGSWDVIAASIPRADPVRAEKFYAACEALGAKGFVCRRTESPANEPLYHLDEIHLSRYDHIVTHGAAGEYGHLQHKQLHNHVVANYPGKLLTFFGFKTGAFRIDLTPEETARKMDALKCYDHELPYDGGTLPKWQALIHRYQTLEGVPINVETYDGACP